MPEAFEQLKNNLSRFMTNPSALLRTCVDNVEAGYNGNISINDPTNPFISLLEMSTAVAVSNLEKLRGACKELYPKLAVEAPELWRHMSDDDFLDPFSKPATAPFTLLLSYNEIISKAVYYSAGGYKKLIIPKHTRIVVNETPFTFQYPIEIRVLEHDGILTVYNTDKPSPILELESNIVKSFKTRIDGVDLLALEFTVEQLNIATRNNIALTTSTGFSKVYNYTDKYYYTRAFVETNQIDDKGNQIWTEIGVTLSDQVFDPLKLTLVAKVYNGTVEYMIPATYFMNGLADGKNLRIWTYTTKGNYAANLAEIVPNSFSYEFIDYEEADAARSDTIYSKPLNTFKTIAIFSPGSCSGGKDAISLDELRNRVIDNATGMPKLPITDDQLVVEWNDIMFDIVKSIDNITDRQYIITRDIPDIETALKPLMDTDLLTNPAISPLSLNVRTFNFNIEEIANYKTVYDNGDRVTILPKTLFMETDGIVSVVDDTIRESFDLMTPLVKANTVNANKYSYTPFHYVLYPYQNTFEAKPFWLSNPYIKRKVFIDDNDKLGVSTSVKSYSMEVIPEGYRILVVTGSNTTFKEIVKTDPGRFFAQLSFIPFGSTKRTFINAIQVDPVLLYGNDQTIVPEGELLFQFDIITTEVVSGVTKGIDIDEKENLVIKNFSMSDAVVRDYTSPLTHDFDIIIIDNKALLSTDDSPIDDDLADWLLPDNSFANRGIIREQFNIKFGSSLDNLWRKSKTIINEESYVRYTDDIPALYQEDIYEMDENGVMKFEIITTNVISNSFDASVGDFPTAGTILKGDTWVVSVAGTIDGKDLIIGNKIIALVDSPIDNWVHPSTGVAQWGTSEIVFNKLHSIGDPILDEFGDPIILYQAGDIMVTDDGTTSGNPDPNGIPVLKDARKINRLVDLCLFEGIYYFADESSSKLYAKTVPDLISTWVNETIAGLNSKFLEQTYSIFYPKTSYGSIQVFVEDTGLVTMRAEQSFFFTVLVKKKVYDDIKIRQSIQNDIVSIVNSELKKPVVSELSIMNQVELKLGGLIEGFKMTLFGDNKDINTFTLKDVTNYLNISKRLEVLPDGRLNVEDNVDFEFILHDYSTNV